MIDKIVSERTNERTNGGTPSERTRIRMVRPGHTEVRRKIEDFVHQVESEQNRTPGVSETSRALGVSKAYASETLKAMGSNGHSDET
jgi:DNA-directed RNA polymerase specialized sigma subunit